MRTLFGKQLALYLGTILISFVFLGAALSQGIRGYFISQRVKSLTDSAERIARSMADMYTYGVFSLPQLNQEITILHRYLDAKVVIIDTDYRALWESGHLADRAAPVYAREMDGLLGGQTIVAYGSMDQLFTEPYLTVGYPFIWNDHPAGAVMVSASMAELEAAVFGLYRIALIILSATALIACLLMYLSVRAVSRPLRQMNDAARIIAGGDFDKRIPVRSRDEVGQLADAFNRMAEGLQEQEKIRSAFIANLSHDLRSPLTSMRGFLQAIQDGTVPEEKRPYYLGIVLDESERLIKLSNNMLDIHRIQEADIALALTDFDLNALIRKTLAYFEKRATDKRLTINCRFAHATDRVCADADMMQRVLYNLLDNAVKFTPGGTGEITVETTVTDKKVTVSIADNGPGLSADEQKRIFDRFYKGDPSRNEDRMGSGLGLSIAREFVKAHGGAITVHSEPGQGAAFTFTMDAAVTA